MRILISESADGHGLKILGSAHLWWTVVNTRGPAYTRLAPEAVIKLHLKARVNNDPLYLGYSPNVTPVVTGP